MKHLTSAGVLAAWLLPAAGCITPAADSLDASLSKYRLSQSAQLAAADATKMPPEARPVRTDVGGDSSWLALAEQLSGPEPNEAPPQRTFTPWRRRRGPAWPGDFWASFGRDAKELAPTIWDDAVATFTDKWALAGLAGAAAAGVALDVANTNGCVADHYRKNRSQLNSFWDSVGDVGGNPGTHFALAGAMYFTSLYRQDVKNYEVSKALLNALAVNGIVTMALKGITHTDSPNGDPFGWPSGHTSSTFALATVMHEAYGPWVGLPLFAFAGFVGYERVDARNHDFNDVISGALIGIAIGHAVYQNHRPRVVGFDVIPYADPANGTVGVALARQW